MKFYNHIVDKGSLKKLIAWAYTEYGSAHCAQMADELKNLGFHYATKAGVSISIDDLVVPPKKKEMLAQAEVEIKRTEDRFAKGEITEVERFQKVIDTWNGTSEELKDEVVRNFEATDTLNSVYMMAFSGARGNLSQVRQLVGMRGLMADPQGQIIDLPIKTNFREGLTVTEYIISSYGARKGLVDTALRTADSGYLTRRLVDVSQDVIVRELDCGTSRGIYICAMKDGDKTLISLEDKLFGRVLAEDIVDPSTGEVIAKKDQDVDLDLAAKIAKVVEVVYVRSPLTCESPRSVCQHCYGWSLAHGEMVNLGEAIGIIAAQSIGEPGTQLTMRTFHTGGVFTGEVADVIKAEFPATIKFGKGLKTRLVRTNHGDERHQVEVSGDLIIKGKGKENKHPLSPGFLLWVVDGDKVEEGDMICEKTLGKAQRSTERATKDVSTGLAGEVLFADLVSEEKTDRQGNLTRSAQRNGLLWVLSGQVYNLLPSAEPVVKNGDPVKVGDVLAETKLVTNQGGVVRSVIGSREIEIITASVTLDQAVVRRSLTGGREQYIIETVSGNSFLLKATPGTEVQNTDVVAELIDDRYRTNSGGIIKYAGLEVVKGRRKVQKETYYEVVKGGTLLWIPEESHEVNKDISLLIVENGDYVEAGTEVVKDIYCQTSGYVEVIQKNDILREIIIKSGDLHLIDDPDVFSELAMDEGDGILLQPGTVGPWGVTEELKYAEIIESSSGLGILLRPVEEYAVADEAPVPDQGSINESSGASIKLRAVQRLFYKDGERVSSVDGVSLLTTQLVLEIDPGEAASKDTLSNIHADIELKMDEDADEDDEEQFGQLQLVILESLILRRDSDIDPLGGNIHTKVLVENGQEIPPGAVIARTEIQCKEDGEVRGIKEAGEAIRRILVVRPSDQDTVELPTIDVELKPITIDIEPVTIDIEPVTIDIEISQELKLKVKQGDILEKGQAIAEGVTAPESGKITLLAEDKVILQLLPFVKKGDSVKKGQAITSNHNAQNSGYIESVNPDQVVIRYDPLVKEGDLVKAGQQITPVHVKEDDFVKKGQAIISNHNVQNSGYIESVNPHQVVIRYDPLVKEGDLVKAGQQITPVQKAPVSGYVKTADRNQIVLSLLSLVAEGDLIVSGTEIAEGVKAEESAFVVSVDDQAIVLRKARPYRVSGGSMLHIDDGDLVQRGDNLVLLIYEKAKTGDIIQGLPRIEELLEARKPKDACVLSGAPGVCQVVYSDDETKTLKIIEDDGTVTDYPISMNQNLLVSDGVRVEVGAPLTDGQPNPHEILETFFNHYKDEKGMFEAAMIGIKEAQKFLVDQVQQVYQSQGIDISDKHIEVIVRQMTAKVRIDDGGDTTMLPGELVELRQIDQVNDAMSFTGSAPANYTPLLLGITKASLNTDSFISAASFQETTRVLTEAAIEGKSDWLRGLKENVIIGRLIPAGTGFAAHQEALLNSADFVETPSYHRDNIAVTPEEVLQSLSPEEDPNYEDVVLDDKIARAYTKSDYELEKATDDFPYSLPDEEYADDSDDDDDDQDDDY